MTGMNKQETLLAILKLKQKFQKKKKAYEQEWGTSEKIDWHPAYLNMLHLNYNLRQLYLTRTAKGQIILAKLMTRCAQLNHFHCESLLDETNFINNGSLSEGQQTSLSSYTLRLIDGARHDLGLPLWTYGQRTQKLANKLANYLEKGLSHQRATFQAARDEGLFIENDQLDDEGQVIFRLPGQLSFTQVKRALYYLIKQMLFGQGQRSKINFSHARNLLSPFQASYALGLAIIPKRDRIFLTAHFVKVTDGSQVIGLGQYRYGSLQVSQQNHGRWQPDPVVHPEIQQEVKRLLTFRGSQLNELNFLKVKLIKLQAKLKLVSNDSDVEQRTGTA